MELNNSEVLLVKKFLYRQQDVLPDVILDKIELGIWISRPFHLEMNLSLSIYSETEDVDGRPLFLSGKFGKSDSFDLLNSFRSTRIPYILIRVNSWECFLNCNGELLSEHCEEDLDSIREACEKLRMRCGG
tara:strand:- start:678 stop:1070 length:393 start_codon:yes stop_codon:yes gene_type:complete